MHRATSTPHDATRHHGIPVTSPARTLLDLATTRQPQETSTAPSRRPRCTGGSQTHSLNEQFSRYPRHRGTAALSKAIRTDPALTRSEAERRLLELIRAARLPTPETNVKLRGHEVDLLWREQRSSSKSTATPSTHRAVRSSATAAGTATSAQGYRVLRITWRELTEEPEALIAELAVALLRCPA